MNHRLVRPHNLSLSRFGWSSPRFNRRGWYFSEVSSRNYPKSPFLNVYQIKDFAPIVQFRKLALADAISGTNIRTRLISFSITSACHHGCQSPKILDLISECRSIPWNRWNSLYRWLEEARRCDSVPVQGLQRPQGADSEWPRQVKQRHSSKIDGSDWMCANATLDDRTTRIFGGPDRKERTLSVSNCAGTQQILQEGAKSMNRPMASVPSRLTSPGTRRANFLMSERGNGRCFQCQYPVLRYLNPSWIFLTPFLPPFLYPDFSELCEDKPIFVVREECLEGKYEGHWKLSEMY
jgi:hypothetical protein